MSNSLTNSTVGIGGVHDVGGICRDDLEHHGAIDWADKPMQHWELQTHALLVCLACHNPPLITTDELRRGVEALEPTVYRTWGYYERWCVAMASMLLERGVITEDELNAELSADESPAADLPRYSPGDHVKVRSEQTRLRWRRPHLRVPGYIYGLEGHVVKHIGAFNDPFLQAFRGHGPQQQLYIVRFALDAVFPGGSREDSVELEIYEDWLLPASGSGSAAVSGAVDAHGCEGLGHDHYHSGAAETAHEHGHHHDGPCAHAHSSPTQHEHKHEAQHGHDAHEHEHGHGHQGESRDHDEHCAHAHSTEQHEHHDEHQHKHGHKHEEHGHKHQAHEHGHKHEEHEHQHKHEEHEHQHKHEEHEHQHKHEEPDHQHKHEEHEHKHKHEEHEHGAHCEHLPVPASSQPDTQPPPTPVHEHSHEHGHDHVHEVRHAVEQKALEQEGATQPGAVIGRALLSILHRQGTVSAETLQAAVQRLEASDKALKGTHLVARAWKDPAFKARLLADPATAAMELGIATSNPNAPTVLQIVANTPTEHHIIVCTLCSCYPQGLLGFSPAWYKSRSYRSRVIQRPREVLEELGLCIPSTVKVVVHDSTADCRYMVLPMPPRGLDLAAIEAMEEEALRGLVTRDSMIGVQIL